MEEQANYNQVEGQIDPNVESTITTSEDKPVKEKSTEFSKVGGNATKFKKEKEPSRVDIIDQNLNGLATYVEHLEKGIANTRNMMQTAIIIMYDDYYKDCPSFKEEDITDTNYQDFGKIIGKYYMKDNVVHKMIPIEEGWKLDTYEKATYTEEYMADIDSKVTEEVQGLNIKFKFEGIVPNADYPTTYECNARNGQEGLSKLKAHLFSLKKKIVM